MCWSGRGLERQHMAFRAGGGRRYESANPFAPTADTGVGEAGGLGPARGANRQGALGATARVPRVPGHQGDNQHASKLRNAANERACAPAPVRDARRRGRAGTQRCGALARWLARHGAFVEPRGDTIEQNKAQASESCTNAVTLISAPVGVRRREARTTRSAPDRRSADPGGPAQLQHHSKTLRRCISGLPLDGTLAAPRLCRSGPG